MGILPLCMSWMMMTVTWLIRMENTLKGILFSLYSLRSLKTMGFSLPKKFCRNCPGKWHNITNSLGSVLRISPKDTNVLIYNIQINKMMYTKFFTNSEWRRNKATPVQMDPKSTHTIDFNHFYDVHFIILKI